MSAVAATQIPIRGEGDIVLARRAIRELSASLGFRPTDTARMVIAASELAWNILKHAGTGVVGLAALERAGNPGLEITCEDRGPGILDPARATAEGGPGMGLPGARRLVDELDLDTAPGRGTTVRIRKWRRA